MPRSWLRGSNWGLTGPRGERIGGALSNLKGNPSLLKGDLPLTEDLSLLTEDLEGALSEPKGEPEVLLCDSRLQ